MAKLDPRLRFLMREKPRMSAERAARFGLTHPARQKRGLTAKVDVLVRVQGAAALHDLRAAGMRVTAITRGRSVIASGEIPLSRVGRLERMNRVRRVEAARPLAPELDRAITVTGARDFHSPILSIRGQGTIVGIIDGGIDVLHPDFRAPDRRMRDGAVVRGNTRIRYLWDHTAESVAGGKVPFGREYIAAEIDAAVRGEADAPGSDPAGHGTHVAGVAAGGGNIDARRRGFAPEADLIVVILDRIGDPQLAIGNSKQVHAAFKYVIDRANGAPVAINLSRGTNGGGHAGETQLEMALDDLARKPNVAIVKSAGNEGAFRVHAGGSFLPHAVRELEMDVTGRDVEDDLIEIWFDDEDDVSIAVCAPNKQQTDFVAAEGKRTFSIAGNDISIDIDCDAADIEETRALVTLSRGRKKKIAKGRWKLLLKTGSVTVGRFDAWIERPSPAMEARRPYEQTQFSAACASNDRTITTPGNARNIITVGSYVTRHRKGGAPVGELSNSSSAGPNRYGWLKPDLVAPGEVVYAPGKVGGKHTLVPHSGTSVAAPAVTGTAALMMSQQRGLRSYQLKQILTRSAVREDSSAGAPDTRWGYGKLDTASAVDLATRALFPTISRVRLLGTTIAWKTDIASRAELRVCRDKQQLQLGRNWHIVRGQRRSRSHKLDLKSLPPGKYFCEIVAYGPGEFFSEDDNDGDYYTLRIPRAKRRRR
ncbi:MAG TPA: S8 family peptidase [Burkholderiales bacterium]|nr:S8 family peptidase [Burkholderiales bacterium]